MEETMAFKPTGWYWEDFQVGYAQDSPERTITKEDVDAFAKLSEDTNPLHLDEAYAKEGPFGKLIAHGMLILSATTGLTCRTGRFHGTTLAFVSLSGRFIRPVSFGDRIRCRMKVTDKKEDPKRPGQGLITFDVRIRNQNDELIAQSDWTLLMKRKPTGV
jgi:acyl dehydratase